MPLWGRYAAWTQDDNHKGLSLRGVDPGRQPQGIAVPLWGRYAVRVEREKDGARAILLP